jgi:hypothetical protein
LKKQAMAKNKTIIVQGIDIKISVVEKEDYFSLTDIASANDDRPDLVIQNWLRNKSTIDLLAEWELMNNPDFNSFGFEGIRNRTGENSFSLSVKKWITETSSIGIKAQAGRYGGTYAHKDIAFAFGYWINPRFQLYVIKEFQRLKIQEAQQEKDALEWNLKRTLAKVNYRIHTDAIKANLIPMRLSGNPKQSGFIYASEADLLNVALFGMTAKEWRIANPETAGNIRDQATGEQLLVLANLESHNAEFIKDNLSQDERVHKLNEIAIYQMQVLVNVPTPMLKGLTDEKSNQL